MDKPCLINTTRGYYTVLRFVGLLPLAKNALHDCSNYTFRLTALIYTKSERSRLHVVHAPCRATWLSSVGLGSKQVTSPSVNVSPPNNTTPRTEVPSSGVKYCTCAYYEADKRPTNLCTSKRIYRYLPSW